MLFRKSSAEAEAKLLTLVGIAVAACIVVLAVVGFANPLRGRHDDRIAIVIDAPFGGLGVKSGSALVLHGVQVGEVTQVANLPGGKVRYAADLYRGPAAGLTSAVGIDYRPANYFGVTGINLRPTDGGQPLTNGSRIETTPAGNFTLQTMLSRLGELSGGVLTPHLIDVIEKATDYTDSLDPLLETMVIVSGSLANVQTVSTAQLLRNTTGISVALPGFINAASNLLENVHKPYNGRPYEWYDNLLDPTLQTVSSSFFGAIGKLLYSHGPELTDVTNLIKTMADVVPGLVPADSVADTARELRTRVERLYSGPPERPGVNARVVLDSLPGVAAPLAAMGGTP
ncbi:MlaD family protein [Mycobacterium sp. pUA109]|uniref:MlaD family protein n=1 Tax=Mycobacterium sp. pUA109 TaxID=3238982 RepID=UPI00351BE250